MNGLLRRLTRRRAATADEPPPETPAASEPVDATVVSHEEGPALSEEDLARGVQEADAAARGRRDRGLQLPARAAHLPGRRSASTWSSTKRPYSGRSGVGYMFVTTRARTART